MKRKKLPAIDHGPAGVESSKGCARDSIIKAARPVGRREYRRIIAELGRLRSEEWR